MGHLADPPHGKLNFVIVNYDQALAVNGATKQKVAQGEFGGSYSIVGGYDREKEMVLLLDLDKAYNADRSTPAKNSGIYWVPLSDLVDAMNTQDTDAKKNRGYLAFSITT